MSHHDAETESRRPGCCGDLWDDATGDRIDPGDAGCRTCQPEPHTGPEAIAALLSEHQTRVSVMGGWSSRNGTDSDRRYGWFCSCGAESPDRFKVDLTEDEVDRGRFLHVAERLSSPGTSS